MWRAQNDNGHCDTVNFILAQALKQFCTSVAEFESAYCGLAMQRSVGLVVEMSLITTLRAYY